MSHMSCFTHHVSGVMCQVSCARSPGPGVMCQVSHVTLHVLNYYINIFLFFFGFNPISGVFNVAYLIWFRLILYVRLGTFRMSRMEGRGEMRGYFSRVSVNFWIIDGAEMAVTEHHEGKQEETEREKLATGMVSSLWNPPLCWIPPLLNLLSVRKG